MNKTRFSQPSKGLRPSRYNSRKLDPAKTVEYFKLKKESHYACKEFGAPFCKCQKDK